jgi:hypothetical protein
MHKFKARLDTYFIGKSLKRKDIISRLTNGCQRLEGFPCVGDDEVINQIGCEILRKF